MARGNCQGILSPEHPRQWIERTRPRQGPRSAAVAWAAAMVRVVVVGMEETGDLGDDWVAGERQALGRDLENRGQLWPSAPQTSLFGWGLSLAPTPEILTVSKEGSGSAHPVRE